MRRKRAWLAFRDGRRPWCLGRWHVVVTVQLVAMYHHASGTSVPLPKQLGMAHQVGCYSTMQ